MVNNLVDRTKTWTFTIAEKNEDGERESRSITYFLLRK